MVFMIHNLCLYGFQHRSINARLAALERQRSYKDSVAREVTDIKLEGFFAPNMSPNSIA